jgi:hypothetical protein
VIVVIAATIGVAASGFCYGKFFRALVVGCKREEKK